VSGYYWFSVWIPSELPSGYSGIRREVNRTTSKLLEVVLEEKRGEIIKSGLNPEELKCDKEPSPVTGTPIFQSSKRKVI